MTGDRPQNPVFQVNADAVDACAPKVICPACGTVLIVKARREGFRRRCQACATQLQYHLEGAAWRVEVSAE
jgi:hypothetical protein